MWQENQGSNRTFFSASWWCACSSLTNWKLEIQLMSTTPPCTGQGKTTVFLLFYFNFWKPHFSSQVSICHTFTNRAFGARLSPWQASNFPSQNKEPKLLALTSEGVKRSDCFPLKPFGKARGLMVGAALGTCILKCSHYFPSTKQ